MIVWLLLIVLLLAAVALLLRQRRRQLRRGDDSSALAAGGAGRTLFNLRQGDIVQFDGRDWVVEDRLLYDDQGFQWLEYLLRDGADRRWLSVVEDDWLELSWLEAAPAALTAGLPELAPWMPEQIAWDGVTYGRRETGNASFTASSRRMNRSQGSCRYGDYRAEGGRVLSIEVWGGGDTPANMKARETAEVEVTIGRIIDPALVTILPGDGRSVYR